MEWSGDGGNEPQPLVRERLTLYLLCCRPSPFSSRISAITYVQPIDTCHVPKSSDHKRPEMHSMFLQHSRFVTEKIYIYIPDVLRNKGDLYIVFNIVMSVLERYGQRGRLVLFKESKNILRCQFSLNFLLV